MSGSFLRPLLRGTSSDLAIRNTRNDRRLAHALIAAFDSKNRRTGLLHHESFADGSAMLIAPTNAVHTFFMKFPIDIAFVTREGLVVKTYGTLPAWRMAAAFGAYAAIEFPAGTLARCETVRGDILEIIPAQQV